MKIPRLILATLTVVALASAGMLTAQAVPADSASFIHRADQLSYIVVIDAGSGGTRAILFSSTPGSLASTNVWKSSPTTAGLSSFESDPAQAGPDAVAPLITQLDAKLSELGVAGADVPIALLATAGLRKLQETNPTAVEEILASTNATLIASGHPVQANGILPANQEASLAWVDTNVLNGSLGKRANSLGIIEMGGASAQVAFRSPRATGPGVVQVTVNGRNIPVVAMSYLGLGANLARDAAQAENSGASFCFPRNATGANPATYSLGVAIPVASDVALYKFRTCSQAYGRIVHTAGKAVKPAAPVALRNVRNLAGFSQASFIGLGGISPILANLDVASGTNEKVTIPAALRATCAGPNAWAKVIARFDKDSTYPQTLCPNASFIRQLLFGKNGVGVAGDRFEGRPALPGGQPSWAGGYATTLLHP